MSHKQTLKAASFLLLACSLLAYCSYPGAAQASTAALNIPLGIADGAGGQTTLYFGQDGWATTALDPSLGEAAYPPLPPSGVFDARFNLPNGDDVVRDYRHANGSNYDGTFVHQLQYQPGDGQKITVYWNLPSGVYGRLQDVITGSLIDVSMLREGSYTIDNPSTFNKLKMSIIYGFGTQIPTIPSINFGSQTGSSSGNSGSSGNFGGYTVVAVREPALKYSVKMESGSSSQVLYFGLDPEATNGLDRFLGEETWPPMPPTGAFDARFNLPGGTDDAIVDYRPGSSAYTGSYGHVLNFQASDANPVKISWELPAHVSGNLNDLATGNIVNVPMSGSGSYTITNTNAFNKLLMKINYALGSSSQTGTVTPVVNSTPSTTPAVVPLVVPVTTIASSTVLSNSNPNPATSTVVIAPQQKFTDQNEAPVVKQSGEENNQNQEQALIVDNKTLNTADKAATASTTSLSVKNLSEVEKTAITTFKNISSQQSLTTAAGYLSGTTQPKNRDLTQEQVALKEFAGTYNRLPASAQDWNIVRALAYSDLELSTKTAASTGTSSQLFYKLYGAWPSDSSTLDQLALSYISGEKMPTQRSLEKEAGALKSFVKIFHYLPKSAQDWNVIRSLAYSGR